jgi:hypothetical protein
MNADQLSLWDLLPEPQGPGQAEVPPPAQVRLMPPPAGTATERLLRVMALRRESSPEAIGEMVAALGDEDEKIRWLAALSLQGTGEGLVIATLRAFVGQAPSAVAREGAEKVLQNLGESRSGES